MKIYASRGNFAVDIEVPTEFDQYIGQDIWVMCALSYHDNWQRYCRFLSKEVLDFGDGKLHVMLYYNAISPEELFSLDEIPENEVRKILTKERNDYSTNMSILTPLKTLDRDALDSILGDSSEYETTESVIDKFVGKDYWIKTKISFGGGTYRPAYIKILSKNGYYIEFQYVDSGYVEEHWGLDPDTDAYSLLHPWRPCVAHIDDIKIITPIEILSTEEIEYELNQCQEYDEYADEEIEEEDLEEGEDYDGEDE